MHLPSTTDMTSHLRNRPFTYFFRRPGLWSRVRLTPKRTAYIGHLLGLKAQDGQQLFAISCI